MRRGPVAVSTKEMGADKKVIKIEEKINLQTLASRMSLKATEVLMKLISMGMAGVNINSSLDADTAKIVASEFGWDVEDVAISEEAQLSLARGGDEEEIVDEEGTEPRPPIVTVMGHVDHGKTSLLDQIRKANVAGGEAGGITQHIGAYRVMTGKGPVTFLDTPGHEAFTAMRARGASVTDIVVLVVAADDGVMPQTREAVNHARAAKVPILVAINKVDKPEADPERVKRQLMELNLVSEDLGGDTIYVPVSAKTREGVDGLLEMIALQSEIMELRANPKRPGHGIVVEALLDRGKGPVARVIVTDGTLRVGDFILSGPAVGKVRAMTDDRGRAVTVAGPSTPVEILGLSDVPNAGDNFDVVKDPKKAQEIAETRRTKARSMMPAHSKMTLEDLAQRAAQADQQELRVIVKADVQGSVEALVEALNRLSTEKVRLSVVNSSVGAITEGDVNLAIASRGIIIGFNVRPAGKAGSLAEAEGIQIRQYNIIYNVIDDIRRAMEGLLAPTLVEKSLGKAEVRQVFKLSKAGVVAGSMVTEGVIKRGARVRVRRAGDIILEGKVTGLKRFKEDVKDVPEGFECGISLDDGWEGMKEGDIFEVFDVEEVRQKL
jgi:translation initiation factor IF-2